MTTENEKKPKLIVRPAEMQDVERICALSARVYPNMAAYTDSMIRGQINSFPEGQFVALYENEIVGHCATFRIHGDVALKQHTWKEVTGAGYAARHDPAGEYLYGMEVCVDPAYRGKRIGQRLYNERKKLCRYLRLKGIIFGGRIPGLQKKLPQVGNAEEYIKLVKNKKMRDPVLSFQLRNGFEILGLLKGYLPSDTESLGYAVHMIWRNPQVEQSNRRRKDDKPGTHLPDTIRVATVQYHQRRVTSFEDFEQYIEYFVDVVADYRADFVTFPELFTLQLLSMDRKTHTPSEAIEFLAGFTGRFKDFMSQLAVRYNINIIGGSHPTRTPSGEIQNISYVFLRDGSVHHQVKIHPTPNERFWWNMAGGSKLGPIMTDCGPVGVLICYDAEFPELARHLTDQGVKILFVPFCTDERQSYLRVRYCAHSRAVENQCYVVMSGNVGNLPGVQNMDIQYAQSCILTPCDFGFSRDGIAADTTPNVEMVAVADLRLETLVSARNSGTVQNLKDRRFDLYHVSWRKE